MTIFMSIFDKRDLDTVMASSKTDSSPATHDVLRGTLDLLILKVLSLQPMHGWAIAQLLEQLSQESLRVGQGSLYPALKRLEEKGWIDSEWKATEENRRAKYYELTPSGDSALRKEEETWRDYVSLVDLILRTT
jgi:transcriptional regulator